MSCVRRKRRSWRRGSNRRCFFMFGIRCWFGSRRREDLSFPPQGSLLRRWADKHPVDGWIGEYDGHPWRRCALSVKGRAQCMGRGRQAGAVAGRRSNGRPRLAAGQLAEAEAANAQAEAAHAEAEAAISVSAIQMDAILASTSWRDDRADPRRQPLPVHAAPARAAPLRSSAGNPAAGGH